MGTNTIKKFVVVVLRFYGPVNPMGSCRARSVYLTTRFYWAGLVLQAVNQYCAHSFARNWQLPFLNQRKGENDRRKYFMINLHERMLPTSARVEPATSWSPVGRASNCATEAGTIKKTAQEARGANPFQLLLDITLEISITARILKLKL